MCLGRDGLVPSTPWMHTAALVGGACRSAARSVLLRPVRHPNIRLASPRAVCFPDSHAVGSYSLHGLLAGGGIAASLASVTSRQARVPSAVDALLGKIRAPVSAIPGRISGVVPHGYGRLVSGVTTLGHGQVARSPPRVAT